MQTPVKLRAFEWIVVVYFAYLATAAIAVPLPLERRRHVVLTAVLVLISILSLARFGDLRSTFVLRDWMPLTYLLIGYWLPAVFVKTPNQPLERALLALIIGGSAPRDWRSMLRVRLVC